VPSIPPRELALIEASEALLFKRDKEAAPEVRFPYVFDNFGKAKALASESSFLFDSPTVNIYILRYFHKKTSKRGGHKVCNSTLVLSFLS